MPTVPANTLIVHGDRDEVVPLADLLASAAATSDYRAVSASTFFTAASGSYMMSSISI